MTYLWRFIIVAIQQRSRPTKRIASYYLQMNQIFHIQFLG